MYREHSLFISADFSVQVAVKQIARDCQIDSVSERRQLTVTHGLDRKT